MTAPVDRPVIHMRDIVKTYYIGQPNELEILHGISLTVHTGEFVAIVGESGCGKTTEMISTACLCSSCTVSSRRTL